MIGQAGLYLYLLMGLLLLLELMEMMVMGLDQAMFEFITLLVVNGNRLDRILTVKRHVMNQAGLYLYLLMGLL